MQSSFFCWLAQEQASVCNDALWHRRAGVRDKRWRKSFLQRLWKIQSLLLPLSAGLSMNQFNSSIYNVIARRGNKKIYIRCSRNLCEWKFSNIPLCTVRMFVSSKCNLVSVEKINKTVFFTNRTNVLVGECVWT